VQIDAATGKEAVEASIAGIKEIGNASQITFEVIQNLSGKAGDIGAILSVIEDVSNQTNLLALNAAIIAAQAGEHGRGFAVVAGEIKALAERTSNSTREIAELIKGVQDETERAVDAIQRANIRIKAGEDLSQQSGEALNKIVSGAMQAFARMEQIAQTTADQALGSKMIRESMEKISLTVSQIGNATREQRQGSELITIATERMKSITGQVGLSLQEQSNVSKLIAQSTENISNMIRQIRRSCAEQSRGSEQIVVAVTDIQSASAVNIEVTDFLEAAAKRLSSQAVLLQSELDKFVVYSEASIQKE
jgi:methyl-accepting chemotaxis protein